MQLVTFLENEKYRLGVRTEAGIVDVAATAKLQGLDDGIPTDVMDVIYGGESSINQLKQLIDGLEVKRKDYVLPEQEINWGPAVPSPNKIICIGLNYAKHAEESNVPIPKEPILFSKYNNALVGHKGVIRIPKVAKQVDFEAELAIIIGKETKEVAKKDALDYVFGYTIANDLSARDLQFRSSQWLLGKSSDGFCPLGPSIVTKDEIEDPNNLEVSLKVNGEVRQQSNTSDMIFHCDEIISYISHYLTLEPGDVILTGTPEGVIMGYPEEKREFLKANDQMSVKIEKLGVLENSFI
jgi:2-keto-4-pentenoate hydratase/2-oxohepta-3-ene-1,7-dioic acid hydratase in catechol pathway